MGEILTISLTQRQLTNVLQKSSQLWTTKSAKASKAYSKELSKDRARVSSTAGKEYPEATSTEHRPQPRPTAQVPSNWQTILVASPVASIVSDVEAPRHCKKSPLFLKRDSINHSGATHTTEFNTCRASENFSKDTEALSPANHASMSQLVRPLLRVAEMP